MFSSNCRKVNHQCRDIAPETEVCKDTSKSSFMIENVGLKMNNGAASDHPDRVEDSAAVLCNRSGTGSFTKLSRVSFPQDCTVNGLGSRWVPPLYSSTII